MIIVYFEYTRTCVCIQVMRLTVLFLSPLPSFEFDELRSSLPSFAWSATVSSPPPLRKVAAAQEAIAEYFTALEDVLKSLDR